MLSNTTARPVWCSRCGRGGGGLDDGAVRARGCRAGWRCPPVGLNGASKAWITSRFQHSASATFSPERPAVGGRRVVVQQPALDELARARRAGRRRSRSPPSGSSPEGMRFDEAVHLAGRAGRSRRGRAARRGGRRWRAGARRRWSSRRCAASGADGVLERLAGQDLRQAGGPRATISTIRRPARRASSLRRASSGGDGGVAGQADAERLHHRRHRRGRAHRHAGPGRARSSRPRPRGTRRSVISPARSCSLMEMVFVPEPIFCPR